MEKRDFFISYTKRDKVWAAQIAQILTKNGYTVYFQENDSVIGDFMSNMEEFLENSQGVVAVWSEAYAKSYFGMMEFRAAYASKMPLIPVRVEDCPKKRLYTSLLHVDLFGIEQSEAERRLLNAVNRAIPRPSLELDADALFQRGADYYFGQNGVIKDYAKALGYWEQAAAKGDASATNNLGVLYEKGQGVAQDYKKARKYYEQAAAKGNAVALYNLGEYYENGYDVVQDYAKALDYFQKSVDAGFVPNAGEKSANQRIKELREKMNGESRES